MTFKSAQSATTAHTVMSRNTASEALRKALELVAAGFSNVRIADRNGRLHAPEAFDRFFVKRPEGDVRTRRLKLGPHSLWQPSRGSPVAGGSHRDDTLRQPGAWSVHLGSRQACSYSSRSPVTRRSP